MHAVQIILAMLSVWLGSSSSLAQRFNQDATSVPRQRGQEPTFQPRESTCHYQLRPGDCERAEQNALQARNSCQADQASARLGGITLKACGSTSVSFGGAQRSSCTCLIDIPSLTNAPCRRATETYERMVQFNRQLSLPAFEEAYRALNLFWLRSAETKINFSASVGQLSEFSVGELQEGDARYRSVVARLQKLRTEIPEFCSLGNETDASFRPAAEAWAVAFNSRFSAELAERARETAELKRLCIPVLLEGQNGLGIIRKNFTRPEADQVCGCIGDGGAGPNFIRLATKSASMSPLDYTIVQHIAGRCIVNLNLEGFAKSMPR